MTSFDFILFSFDFVRIFFVLGKRNIKIVQKYIFTLVFNKSRLRKKKQNKSQMGKVILFKLWVDKMNSSLITSKLTVITPYSFK